MLKHKLVKIERHKIKGNAIYGFILDESDELLLLYKVHEFWLDGLVVLAKSDITRIETDRSCMFQTKLLKDLGRYDDIPFDTKFDLTNWRSFFESATKKHKYFIIEEERSKFPMFYIGMLKKVKKRHVKLLEFSGAGNWRKKPTWVYYEDISLCQINSEYCNIYENYFEKITLSLPNAIYTSPNG